MASLPQAAGSTGTSRESLQAAKDVTWCVSSPIIFIFGVVGNSLILRLLWKFNRRSTAFVFFRALAMCDLFIMVFGLFPRFIECSLHVDLKKLNMILCVFFEWTGFSSGILSADLLVAMTVNRLIAAVLPHRVHHVCNPKRVYRLVVGLVVLDLARFAYVPMALDLSDPDKCRFTPYFRENIEPWLGWINSVQFSLGPSLIIMASNAFIIRALNASARKSRSVVCNTPDDVKARHSNITRSVVAVSLCFLLLTLPTSLMRIIKNLKGPGHDTFTFNIFYTGSQVLWYVNGAINFYLYVGTNKELRQLAWKRLTRVCGTWPAVPSTAPSVNMDTSLPSGSAQPDHLHSAASHLAQGSSLSAVAFPGAVAISEAGSENEIHGILVPGPPVHLDETSDTLGNADEVDPDRVANEPFDRVSLPSPFTDSSLRLAEESLVAPSSDYTALLATLTRLTTEETEL